MSEFDGKPESPVTWPEAIFYIVLIAIMLAFLVPVMK